MSDDLAAAQGDNTQFESMKADLERSQKEHDEQEKLAQEQKRLAEEAVKAAAAAQARAAGNTATLDAISQSIAEGFKRARPDEDRDKPTVKREFNFDGQLIEQVFNHDCEGITYCRDIKGAVHDSIARNEFISLGKLMHNLAEGVPMAPADMRDPGYATKNVPPPPENIKSLVELLKRLLLFGSFYLQKFPGKMVSFFDYLLFLIEYSENLTMQSLVTLDHLMRQDFASNPEWNWAQHRAANTRTRDRVLHKDRY